MNPDGPGMALGARRVGLNGGPPHCEHLDVLQPVTAHANECRDCQAAGTAWVALMVCLTCGWVACSDDSPGRHALAHYEETDHPVVRALRPGPSWKWCYVHRRAV
jgi:uncharacterized UBP type Zn finger protein